MTMKNLFWLCMLCASGQVQAQIDTSDAHLTFSGYAEIYYSYAFSRPADHQRPAFLYSHNRHNEFNLNLGFIKTNYTSDRLRANIALAAGTYMNANYANEPGGLQHIYEANAGYKLSSRKNVWIDAGILASHIGFESAVSKDCWALTRSIPAENSPYYESGIKLTYQSGNSKWLLSGLLLNGWQHIHRPDGNNSISLGTQITYTSGHKLTLNYSTFVGNDKPDAVKQMRYFQNFYGIVKWTKAIDMTIGFDLGLEQKTPGSLKYFSWYSPVMLIKCSLGDHWSITGRAEGYIDQNGVTISTGTLNGFQLLGTSLNLDCEIRANAVWRVESRWLKSKDEIFSRPDGSHPSSELSITTSLAVYF